MIGANRLLTQLKRELNLNIDQLEVTQENAKLAHKRADSLQEVADKHAKDLLESRMKIEEQTKTIEQLANAVLKREKELNENKRVLIMQEEELKAVEKNAKEKEERLKEKEKEMKIMEEDIKEKMEEKFKRERDEMKETAEAELKRQREKHASQVETLQKARSPQKEEDETKKREREEEEKKKEETMIELRKEIERLKEELEKKPEEQPVIIETVVQSPPPPPPPRNDQELEQLRRTCKEQSETIQRLEREVGSLDDVINEQIAMLEENIRVDKEAENNTNKTEEENNAKQQRRAQDEAKKMEFIRDETRAILETAIAEKTNLLDLRDKEISSLKQSIETLKRSAEVKQRKFEDKLSEEKSKHELELMTLQTRLEASSASAKYYADAEADAKRRVEVLERQNSKRIIEEATLRETNMKNTSQQKAQREQNLSKRDAAETGAAPVPTVSRVSKTTVESGGEGGGGGGGGGGGEGGKEEEEDDDDEEAQSSSPPFRDAKKDVANLRKKVAEARKNAKSAANSPSSPNFNGGKSPNAQKRSEISELGERSIVKRAIEAQKRVEEAAKGLNRVSESQKRLFH